MNTINHILEFLDQLSMFWKYSVDEVHVTRIPTENFPPLIDRLGKSKIVKPDRTFLNPAKADFRIPFVDMVPKTDIFF